MINVVRMMYTTVRKISLKEASIQQIFHHELIMKRSPAQKMTWQKKLVKVILRFPDLNQHE